MLHLSSRLLLGSTSAQQNLQYLIFYALHTASLSQCLRVQRHAEALVYLYGELNGHDRCQSHIAQHCSNTKVLGIDNLSNDIVYLLLQNIQRSLDLLLRISNRLNRSWQSLLVHLLVLVQRYSVYLHSNGWNHVRRFLLEDEVIKSLNIHLLVADDIGSNKLSSAIFVECLHRSILDAWKLANDNLYLFEFDAEATNLHLTVLSAHKLNVAIRQIAHDVA